MVDWKFLFERWILRHPAPPSNEPKVKKRLKGLWGDLFVDIGANHGMYSLLLSNQFHKVIAFEPSPAAFPVLLERTRKCSNLLVRPVALADKPGKMMLYNWRDNSAGAHSTIMQVFDYKPVHSLVGRRRDVTIVGKNGIEVPVSTYDQEVGREIADLVKIDVEGAEFLVLDGMRDSLEHERVLRLVVELHDREKRRALEEKLQSYRPVWLDRHHLYGQLPDAQKWDAPGRLQAASR